MTARHFFVSLLAALLLASSVSLVYVQHLRRSLFSEYKQLQLVRDQMLVQWGQLQLEASTWAAEDRIEKIATSKLKMKIPQADAVVVVTAQ